MADHSTNLEPSNDAPASSLADRLSWFGFIAGSCGLLVFAGLMLAAFDTVPYRWTKDAVSAFVAYSEQRQMLKEKYPAHNWQLAYHSLRGAEPGDTAFSSGGLTLHGTGGGTHVVLLDMQGREVQRWDAPFSKVWPNPSFAKSLIPSSKIHVRRAHVYANGDLLAQYATTFSTPSGIGLARLDRNSNVLWSYDGNCHHDFGIDQDGDIFVLTHEVRRSVHPRSKFGNRPIVEDFVSVVSDKGIFKKRFSLLDALFDSPYYRPKVLSRTEHGDLLHANTINVIDEQFASHYPEIRPGDLMVCYRNPGLVVVINPESEKIVWAFQGPWHYPHDPDPLANGNILIFDNIVARGSQVGSRVVEVDPRTGSFVWEYFRDGQSEELLRSDIRSTQQRLPNDNVLICESERGRILEVNRQGQIVWQYVNPVRGGRKSNLVPIMTGVHRYALEELPFIDRDTRPNQIALNSRQPADSQ